MPGAHHFKTVGVTDRVWEVADLVAMLEAEERGLNKGRVTLDVT